MRLVEFRDWIPERWGAVELDDWSDQLRAACGQFTIEAFERRKQVCGGVVLTHAAGLEIAHVADDVASVQRTRGDIRRDFGESVFLIFQCEGSSWIEQKDRREHLDEGDCILIDSAAPSNFYFNGAFSDHLSLHLPRETFLQGGKCDVDLGRRLGADDPMSTMLRALLAKLCRTSVASPHAANLCELMFESTRQAFAHDDGVRDGALCGDSCRLEIAKLLIDQNLTSERLTSQWVAEKVGASLRTLQREFQMEGHSLTSYIRLRRLCLARERLRHAKGRGGVATIAEVAYSCGFNDISYFNRCFRSAFQLTPGDFLRQAGEKMSFLSKPLAAAS